MEEKYSFGQKMADKVAKFGGSWFFVLFFIGVLIVWILINLIPFILESPFDPYPFIFLNLVLSCLAALQAPIIMMSQNRQAEKDREMQENDYAVNRRAKVEIEEIQAKLNYLIDKLDYHHQEAEEFMQKTIEEE